MSQQSSLLVHGSSTLPSVTVESYNVEVKDEDGFVGDRARKGAFIELLTKWRKVISKGGDDPFDGEDIDTIGRKELDELLLKGDPDAAGVVQSAIEEFAQELATVIKRFQKLKAWRDTERLVVGGGFRARRVGELAIGRAAALLKVEQPDLDLTLIRNDPDEAGLIGAAHLAPPWIFKGHNAVLAADIGGTNIRAGIVELNLKSDPTLGKASVVRREQWRHGDQKNLDRKETVAKLAGMLEDLLERAAKQKLRLAPFIGIGCPGIIEEDGSILRGASNLPGKWEGKNFNLPRALLEAIPKIEEHDTVIVMHNDAVVQGLSERPFMDDVERWGVLTIGTGFGNAQFCNRREKD
jgi:predicted NBD/HSP70 family sugar kinase